MSGPGLRPSRSLQAVLGDLAEVPAEVRICDLTLDSRSVTPGAAFIACRGHRHHGLEYAERAAAAGARAILWESAPGLAAPPLDGAILVREIPQLRRHLGAIADRFFDAPSAHLRIAAITGTNGKTTCAWLLAQALALLGRRAAYLGTLGVGTLDALQPLEHTTPDVLTLHRLLARLLAEGIDSIAMEVSSHALAQQRCAGLRLHTAAFTNLTRDHLDYHGDMDSYGAAKARLLAWPALRARVINVDDAFGQALAQQHLSAASGEAASARLWLTSRHALAPRWADAEYVCASRVALTHAGVQIELHTSCGRARLESALRGEFNVENLLTVLAMLLAFEVPLAAASAALSSCRAPPGRLQAEGGGSLPLVLIDYAHTPDALAKALAAARAHCQGKLWCVFGCGGERDPGKRSPMGRVAAEAADELIVTDDNPRLEDPQRIVATIMEGVSAAGKAHVRVIHDRGKAIVSALQQASAADVVLVAGKGHEDYQLIGAERRPFSDTACVRGALASRVPA